MEWKKRSKAKQGRKAVRHDRPLGLPDASRLPKRSQQIRVELITTLETAREQHEALAPARSSHLQCPAVQLPGLLLSTCFQSNC
jgi:hypothetical protein